MEEHLKQQANCLKVVLFGAESTGKTTLCKQLAAHYNTVWVPEYARDYLQEKWDKSKGTYEYDDSLPIAKGQMQLENELAKQANKLLICDTNLLETKVYSEVYFDNKCPDLLHRYALKASYDLYFLTYIDTPWEADDLRDKPDERTIMHVAFKNELVKHNIPYILLKGNESGRFTTAIQHIDKLLAN